ncbi:MAG TPA: hypothetical protein VFJ61_07945 [Solirubrobacterales bacterium]|nr:hypothetical protein [Solirubrobacterales bacterium]
MSWARVVLGLVAVLAAGALVVSGGSEADPRTPKGLPGLPPPFLGTAVLGSGELTAAVDAYGDVVDLRAGPGGSPLIENPLDRQRAGTVAAQTGIVPWVRVGGGKPRPLWTADSVRQHYVPGTNLLVTIAQLGDARVRILYAAGDSALACLTQVRGNASVSLRSAEAAAAAKLRCDDPSARRIIAAAARGERRWLRRAQPLGAGAPPWAERMYERSLLVLRALTDRGSGAAVAGARDGWAYVWPRDAATVAMAYEAAGYGAEAELVTRFLLGLGLEHAARFHGDGSPVPGREAQGDATGWVAAAARASGLIGSTRHAARILSPTYPLPWRGLADYQEGEPGDFLANALASGESGWRILDRFGSERGLEREAGPAGGLDTAAAWAVRPFPRPALADSVRRTLIRLGVGSGRYGLLPGDDWGGGRDPWTAPAAWSTWSLAALAREEAGHPQAATDRALALHLLGDLRRAATPAGALPERVASRTGVATSTTPLAWTHAFAVLALQQMWPGRTASNSPSGR